MKTINTNKWECIDKMIWAGETYKLWEHKVDGDNRYYMVTFSNDNSILTKTYDDLFTTLQHLKDYL